MITSVAIHINKEKIDEVDAIINTSSLLQEQFILIQRGRRNYHLVIFEK